MKAKIKIVIISERTNLNESLRVLVKKDWWDVKIEATQVTVISQKEYNVPEHNWSKEGDIDLDSQLNRRIDGVVAHVRDCSYISFGLTLKWGYEAWYGSVHANSSLDLVPSIHQSGSSTTFDINDLDIERAIFKDVGSTKSATVRTMLGYWRRAEELSDLSFHTEAYLNYFKVLECLESLKENDHIKKMLTDRFAPNPSGAKDRTPMKKIRRHVGKGVSDGSLVKHIIKAATIFASAGYSEKISSDFFIHILDLIHVRNHYNVAHHLLRVIKDDWFIGVGQHSDEFERVIPDLSNMKQVSKMMILNYIQHGKYQFNGRERKWSFR